MKEDKSFIIAIVIVVILVLLIPTTYAIVTEKNKTYDEYTNYVPESANADKISEEVKKNESSAEIIYDDSIIYNETDILSESLANMFLTLNTEFKVVYSVLKQYCDSNGYDIASYEIDFTPLFEDNVWCYKLTGPTEVKIVVDYDGTTARGYLKED